MENTNWADGELFWSTLLYHETWDRFDKPLCQGLIDNAGMTAKFLRTIGHEYRINRGIPKRDKASGRDNAAETFTKILNEKQRDWPEGLVARAHYCWEIVERGMAEKCLHGRQVSASSKFMWFLKPHGWTVYDQFAARGLKAYRNSSPRESLVGFYTVLEQFHFQTKAALLQTTIDKTSFKHMPAERILDFAMMRRGSWISEEKFIAKAQEHMNSLSTIESEKLKPLAVSIQEKHKMDLFN